jgi:hypothetical protein
LAYNDWVKQLRQTWTALPTLARAIAIAGLAVALAGIVCMITGLLRGDIRELSPAGMMISGAGFIGLGVASRFAPARSMHRFMALHNVLFGAAFICMGLAQFSSASVNRVHSVIAYRSEVKLAGIALDGLAILLLVFLLIRLGVASPQRTGGNGAPEAQP